MAKEKSNSLRNAQEDLRSRLREVAAKFSQAELARRAGSSPANVNRYLREGKIPGEFCALLVREFQVNPNWLLAGEQGMLRTDVSHAAGKVSGELLAVVEAMNAVARMRLGAVSAEPARKTLRELDEALTALDRLRAGLNRSTGPALAATLQQLDAALTADDLARAGTLRSAAVRLSRLCQDEALLERLDSLQSWYCYVTGKVEEALVLDRRLFSRHVLRGEIVDEPGLQSALWLAMELRDSARVREALRTLRAALALSADAAGVRERRALMRMHEASLCGELGWINEALAIAMPVYPELAGIVHDADMMAGRIQVLAGICTWEQALARLPAHAPNLRILLRMACALEDEPRVARGLKQFPAAGLPPDEYDTRFAALLLAALRGKGKLADHDRILAESPPRIGSRHMREAQSRVHRAQLARLLGNRKALRQATGEAEALLASAPPSESPRLDWLPVRRRNMASCRHTALAALDAELAGLASRGCRLYTHQNG